MLSLSTHHFHHHRLTGWRVKYNDPHWRPVTAFRTGWPGFEAQPNWEGLIPCPSHPEYPSGHTFTIGAVFEVLNRTLKGNDKVGRKGRLVCVRAGGMFQQCV